MIIFIQYFKLKGIITFLYPRSHQSSLFHWIICAVLIIKDIQNTNTLEYPSRKDQCLLMVLIEFGASQPLSLIQLLLFYVQNFIKRCLKLKGMV